MTAATAQAGTPDDDLDALLAIATDLVRHASDMALDPIGHLHLDGLQIDTKSDRNDLVTAVDRGIEDYMANELTARTGYGILGEEGHTVDSFAGRVWVLDPIDGTMNYVQTHRDYAISLALCQDGVPLIGIVADVVGAHLYTAIRGRGARCDGRLLPRVERDRGYRDSVLITDLKEIRALPRLMACLEESRGHRRYGSAALECVEVACARAGGFVHMWVSPWDIAAATLICQETGAVVTRLDGTPLDVRHKGSILAGSPQTHRELLQRLMADPR